MCGQVEIEGSENEEWRREDSKEEVDMKDTVAAGATVLQHTQILLNYILLKLSNANY